jgi:hypothetical protein
MSKDEKAVKTKAAKPDRQKNNEIKIFKSDGTVNQVEKEDK